MAKKIFVADDDPDILEIVSLMLKTAGYQVYATPNAAELFNPGAILPDLILLDIWMSGTDGRDICKRVKENPLTKDIPVVFLSANTGIREIATVCEARDFIAKPFEMQELLSKLHTILQEEASIS